MHRILFTCFEAAIAAVFLYPLILLLDKKQLHNRRLAIGYFLFSVYLSAMFAVAGLPNIRYIRFEPSINLKPFSYMFTDLTSTLLNVVLFLPMGLFLPLLWRRFRKPLPTVLFGFCTSLLIESLQIFTFRATDINDLITNTLGTAIGWCAGRILLRLCKRIDPSGRTQDVYTVCTAALGVMFFLQPFLADWIRSILF